MKLSELGEDRFLDTLRERVGEPGPEVKLGIGDDAAAISLEAGQEALLSTDVLVEGIHFTHQTLPPSFIGRKAVAVNVSDIAAMGGDPVALVVSLCVAQTADVDVLLQAFDGVIARSSELGVAFVGGNLSGSLGPMVFGVSILGNSLDGKWLARSGARPGDAIYISGKLGAASEGFNLLEEGMAVSGSGAILVPNQLREGPVPLAEHCLRAHMDPEPRVELGQFLNRTGVATACIDLSDGLTTDLLRLCHESGVGARIEETALPIHPGVLAWERVRRKPPLEQALSGGEDYELLFTVSDESALSEWDRDEAPLTRIGAVIGARDGVELVLRDGTPRPLTRGGWDHFKGGNDPSNL